ncbi:helix-turn-helix transcriptional regulator [Marinilactibacillus psychrotolerans]|uniref:helix-turn-helix transcriptional regulator n=1 Tax=Marinilactibacillus psychrotolerans TaxID=191770 RepID=UPI003883BF3D
MSLHRQFELIYLLLEKPMITAQELAEHFEVSTRTIYRDIDVLSSTGIPVYTTRGQGGGISLLEGYTLHAALLSNAERENILTGLQTLEATGLPYTKELLKKILHFSSIKRKTGFPLIFLHGVAARKIERIFFN